MSDAWKGLDLGGGGLQAANLALARRMKRRGRAYALLAIFPTGLHRAYLEDRRGAWIWRIAVAVSVGLAVADWRLGAAALALLVAALAYDAIWIDRRVTAQNKVIRREVFLSQSAAPPKGYRGRYLDDEPAPDDRSSRGRAPSFAEQEALLRELARRRERPGGDAPSA